MQLFLNIFLINNNDLRKQYQNYGSQLTTYYM